MNKGIDLFREHNGACDPPPPLIDEFNVEETRENAKQGEDNRHHVLIWHGYISDFKARQSANPP